MKKGLFLGILLITIILGACSDKPIETQYTIGCIGYRTSDATQTQWTDIEEYMSSAVAYNKLVTYENKTVAENDAQAREFFDEQMQIIDTELVCSKIHTPDYLIYGIETLKADGTYRVLKAVKFSADGVENVD